MSVHVITASAGSGKTYRLTQVLSERLSRTTEDSEPLLRANEVIATTFTVRAAADLLEKTQKRLLDDGNVTAAEEIGTALIGTVNSMSGRLVTEYAIDAGFSPEPRVLEESEQKTVFATAVDEVVAKAESTHRNLLVRTGHNGRPEDVNPFGHGPVAWSTLVRTSPKRHGRTTSARLNCVPLLRPRFTSTSRLSPRNRLMTVRRGGTVWPLTSTFCARCRDASRTRRSRRQRYRR